MPLVLGIGSFVVFGIYFWNCNHAPYKYVDIIFAGPVLSLCGVIISIITRKSTYFENYKLDTWTHNKSMQKVWCGYYEGNNKSKRVQEKCGFKYQWRSEKVGVPLMHEKRTGHVSLMTKEAWMDER